MKKSNISIEHKSYKFNCKIIPKQQKKQQKSVHGNTIEFITEHQLIK